MNKAMFLAVPALALGTLTMAAAPASAHAEDAWSSQAILNPLNNSGTSGQAMVDLHGNEATVSMNVTGAAETFMDGPFPHAQHIHSPEQAAAECPATSADTDGDGAINTSEGLPSYGGIVTSLTTAGDTSADSGLAVDRFPGGGAYTYERTIELNAETRAALEDGTAVVVVHGVDPGNMPAAAAEKMSDLDPSLPAAATLPAACGVLTAAQMKAMPEGGADTGVAQETGGTTEAVAIGGGILVAAASAAWALRRRAVRA